MAGCPNFLGFTYLHLFASALITTVFAKYPLFELSKDIAWPFLVLFFIAFLGLLIVLMAMSPGPLKYIVFAVYLAIFGTILSKLDDRLEQKGILFEVVATVTAIFLSMTALGFYDKDNILGFGPYLFAALVGLIVARLILLLVVAADGPSQGVAQTNTLLSVVGTGLFSVFVAFDTQVLKREAKACKGNPDYINASLGLYLDIVNLMSNVTDLYE
jgi:FtsH-binding integral membrane protein